MGGGSHQPVSNRFGEVNLPLGDDPGLFAFGQAAPLDPSMYVGDYPVNTPQQSYYDLPPSSGFPPVDYSSYPSYNMAQEVSPYPQQSYDEYMQSNAQEQQQPARPKEGRRRRTTVFVPPNILESSVYPSAPTHTYELPPGLKKEHRKSQQKSKNYTGEPKRKDRAEIPFWGGEEDAVDDMTAQTAGMMIGSLAPIQTAGGGGYDLHSGSMTSRLSSKIKGKGKGPRLPQEPQTARFASRKQSRPVEQEEEEEEEGEEEEEEDGSQYIRGRSKIESDLTRYCRALVQKTWLRRNLNCIQYSAEQLSAIFAELKIAYPGNEWGISKEATSLVRKHVPGDVDKEQFMKDFLNAKNSYRSQINYLKSSFVEATGREMPPTMLLDEFRKAKEKLEESRLRVQQQKSGKKTAETREPRRRKGKQTQQQAIQEVSSADEAVTADKVWNDFFTTCVAPALSAGYAYDMTLIGYLLPRYIHKDHDQQQTQAYIIKYLHDVQGASDADLKQLYDVATSGGG